MKTELAIVRLLGGKNLKTKEVRNIFFGLFKKQIPLRQAKTFILLLAHKGETAEELLGAVSAILRLEPPMRMRSLGLIDTCGTGGDHSFSINISTLAAFVIAACGGKVAKHGNRSVTSRCGSSDLMRAMGIDIAAPGKKMRGAINRCGLGYFHAPFYHPIFANIQPLRRQLQTRTIFNLLGPLVNPCVLEGQLVGVSKPAHLKLFAEILRKKKLKRAMVCHSRDGMDEISTRAITDVRWIEKGKISHRKINPKGLGFSSALKNNYTGGPPKKNSSIALRILRGTLKGPPRDIVVLNSAAGLQVGGRARNLRQGIKMATDAIDSGRAYGVFLRLRDYLNRKSTGKTQP